MPKAQAKKAYSTLIKGMITEAGPLTFPENATTDELNCDLFMDGSRKRRRGFNLETSSALSSQTVALATWDDYAISTHVWKTAGGDSSKNFLLVQIGPTVYFYDMSVSPLSSAQKSFTIVLTTYAAPSAVNIANFVIRAASGKGFLFITGEKIESLLVKYVVASDTITVTQIDIEIRDFTGVDDTYAPDFEPTTLTNLHDYNLKNQGWLNPYAGEAPGSNISLYFTFSGYGKYPPNSKQYWKTVDTTGVFVPLRSSRFAGGNTLAPRGHYILKAFYEDRSTVSGVAGITIVSTTGRPVAVSFFAGRVWYAGVIGVGTSSNIYFSQILDTTAANAGKCYSKNDPTSEDLNDLLSDDGGVIVIPEAGKVLALFPMQNAIIVITSNGVWSIAGGAGGFKATDFIVSKISSSGAIGQNSVVDVDGTPVWWNNSGISTIVKSDTLEGTFKEQSLTQTTIKSFYDAIPTLCRDDVVGRYDASTKKIYWLYRETKPTSSLNRYRFNRVLVFDTRLGAFYPWKISTFSSTPYYIGSVFSMPSLFDLEEDRYIYTGDDLVVNSTNSIIDTALVPDGSSVFINFLTFIEGTTNVQWTFGNFTNSEFHDWYNVNTAGVEFTSFFETGDELMQDIQREKVAVYVQCYFNKTETTYTNTRYISYVNPSGCYMQAKWEWSDHTNSGKFSPKKQVYRFVKSHVPLVGVAFNNGLPVVVTKNKIRGTGKALRLRFESETGKDFDFLGWALAVTGNTEV